MGKKTIDKESIIAEYLTGTSSYRKIGIKYGVDFRIVHSWVMKYQGKTRNKIPKPKTSQIEEPSLSNEVKQLQRELRKAQLHNKLLNAMIDIAEDQLKIDIRKKSGTKQ
jgi:transposase-like protein